MNYFSCELRVATQLEMTKEERNQIFSDTLKMILYASQNLRVLSLTATAEHEHDFFSKFDHAAFDMYDVMKDINDNKEGE